MQVDVRSEDVLVMLLWCWIFSMIVVMLVVRCFYIYRLSLSPPRADYFYMK